MKEVLKLGVVMVVIVALAMEYYKKGLRGYKSADGKVHTRASDGECEAVALVLSSVFAVMLHMVADLGLGWFVVLVYMPLIFFLQFYVDMQIVKKIVNETLTRLGGKV